jgi:hypothetical protein
MKLEFIAEGSPDCPLIRLYDLTTAEATQLIAAVADLASGGAGQLDVHGLPFVESVDGCCLTLIRRSWDQAVVRIGPSNFECGFTAGTWDNVAGLVEPFRKDLSGYQWLAGSPGEANVLLSASGQW